MKHETIGRKRNWNSTENEKKNRKPSMCAFKIENWCLWVYQQTNQAGKPHSCVLTTIWHATMLSLLPTLTAENSQFHANKKLIISFCFLFKKLLYYISSIVFSFFFVIFIIAFLFSFSTESLWMNSPMLCMLSSFIFFVRVENVKLLTKWIVNHGSWSKWVRKMVESAIIKECRFDTNQEFK